MAVATAALVRPAPVLSGPWIMSPVADLAWFVGSLAAGLALFAGHAFFGLDLLAVWLPWIVLLNGPHLFATYTRTYMVGEEWRSRAPLLVGSLAVFLIGPAFLLASHLLQSRGVAWHRAPVAGFLTVAVLWAYWHAVRQHHGILRVYHRKDPPAAGATDSVVLHVGLLAPFVYFLSRHAEAREILHLPESAAWLSALRGACIAAFALCGLAFLGGLALRLQNLPRALFLAALLAFYAVVGFSDAILAAPLLGVVPVFIIPHDIQYLAIVRFYNRNRRDRALLRGERPDLGSRLTGSIPAYAACALSLGALLAFLGIPFASTSFAGSTPVLSGSAPIGLRDLLLVLFQGFFLHHYFLDQFVWRPGRDPHVARNLGISPAP